MDSFTWADFVGSINTYQSGDLSCVTIPCWYDIGLPTNLNHTEWLIIQCAADASCQNFKLENIQLVPQSGQPPTHVCQGVYSASNPDFGITCSWVPPMWLKSFIDLDSEINLDRRLFVVISSGWSKKSFARPCYLSQLHKIIFPCSNSYKYLHFFRVIIDNESLHQHHLVGIYCCHWHKQRYKTKASRNIPFTVDHGQFTCDNGPDLIRRLPEKTNNRGGHEDPNPVCLLALLISRHIYQIHYSGPR